MKVKTRLDSFKKNYNRKWKFVMLVLPSLFLYLLFCVYPNVSVFPMSFYKWNPLSNTKTYVGLHNYIMMFTVDLEDTIEKAVNTLVYVGGLFLIQTVFAFILALALQKNTRRDKFFRAYFFLPMVFSSTMISMTWSFMLDPNLGIINTVLGKLGVEGFPGVNFMAVGWKAVLIVVLVHIWANLGYPLTVLTSGLNTISGDLSEAAAIDGANAWQQFTKITLPLMLPTLFRLTLMTISTGTMAVDYIFMMGTKDSQTWASTMYTATRNSIDYGPVMARGVLMFFILATASIVQFVAMRKVEDKILG